MMMIRLDSRRIGGRSRLSARDTPTPPLFAPSAPCARGPRIKRQRVAADATSERGGRAVVAARRPPPLPPAPTAAAAAAIAAAPAPLSAAAAPPFRLPDPALQRAVAACASWRDCADLLRGPHAPRLDAMLVCALATRAAQLGGPVGAEAEAEPEAAEDGASCPFAAFVHALASAALERATSSRPQQFAQVAVSLARLASGGSGGDDQRRRRRRRDEDDGNINNAPSPLDLRPWLDRYLAAAEVHLPRFSARRMCQLAWAAAKLSTAGGAQRGPPTLPPPPALPPPPPPALPGGERWWASLLSEAQDRLPVLRDGRDWSNLLWALARLGVAVPPGWADDALAALVSTRSEDSGGNAGGDDNGNGNGTRTPPPQSSPVLATMRPRERATVLWALARMGVAPAPGWVARELAPALLCRPSQDERRAEQTRRRERRERPWRRPALPPLVLTQQHECEDDAEEHESARDVAVSLWALARWQRFGPQPDATGGLSFSSTAAGAGAAAPLVLADALAARAALALDRELPPSSDSLSFPTSTASSAAAAAAAAAAESLTVALASLARLPGGGGGGCAGGSVLAAAAPPPAPTPRCWLSLARRALPSLSGRGLARLARATAALRLRPPPEWMRAVQARALRLLRRGGAGPRAGLRAGELAAVLGLFASARWFPGAAWWAAVLSATAAGPDGGVLRTAPLREAAALARACRGALGVGAAALAARRRPGGRGSAAAAAADGGDQGGLLAAVVLGARRRAVVARWAEALWERAAAVEAEEGAAFARRSLLASAEALLGRRRLPSSPLPTAARGQK